MVKIITEAQASKRDNSLFKDAGTVRPFAAYGEDQNPSLVLLRLAAKTQPRTMSAGTKALLNGYVKQHNDLGSLSISYPKGYRDCAAFLAAVLNVRGRCNRIT